MPDHLVPLPSPPAHVGVLSFNGHEIDLLMVRGELAVLLAQVGDALGYVDNAAATSLREWQEASELVEGEDFFVSTGEELRHLKALTDSMSAYASHALLLTESGFHGVLLLSKKPAGKQLRRKLRREVMPQIARDGRYDPDREVVQGQIVATPQGPQIDERERRLLERERRSTAKLILGWVEKARPRNRFDEKALDALEVDALRRVTGQDLGGLLPKVDDPGWLTATDVADQLGTTAAMVGRVRKHLGLEGNREGLCEVRITNPPGRTKSVEQTVFSPAASDMIRDELARRGKITVLDGGRDDG